jgi:hypothetical protein
MALFLLRKTPGLLPSKRKPNKMNKKETIRKYINGKYFARKDNAVSVKRLLTQYRVTKTGHSTTPKMFRVVFTILKFSRTAVLQLTPICLLLTERRRH